MKVLLSWLREFADVPGSAEEVAATMSVRGFAVEGIDRLEADAILDFEVTANRPDCMCILGIAREVATAFGLSLREGGTAIADPARRSVVDGRAGSGAAGPAEQSAGIDVTLESPDLCPRYAAVVADVTIGPSPDWMQARLRAAGLRPISNIVDITNYVLLERGQPMHAFDLTRLEGAQIRVRTARAGEKLRTLDGQMRDLSPEMLVIADANDAVAVAGVMGGADSEVGDSTETIVFESAYFDPLSVRRTSRTLGLKTEASMRFERGTDPHLPVTAMRRALELLVATGAGQPRGAIVDRHRVPFGIEPRALVLRRSKIRGLLGTTIADGDVEHLLAGLGFSLVRTEDGWRVSVPTRRVDITREVDLIEELARHNGFDRIPSTFPALLSASAPMDPRITRARQLRSVMTGAGFSEAVTFGFIAERQATMFAPSSEVVGITNPLSESFAVLRPSALPGLVGAVAHNRRRQQKDVRLFEIAARFSHSTGERRALACAWTGSIDSEHWSGGAREVDFFDMKGVVERIGEAFRVHVQTATHREPWLVPGRTASIIVNDARVGVMGQLMPAIAEEQGLPTGDAVYVAELDLDATEAIAAKTEIQVEALPRYPSVTRDISILVDDTLPAAIVRATIREAAPDTLVRVREFDRYQGKGVPEGKISLSLRLTFRSPERTLTDAEVQAAMEAVLRTLREKHGAVQR